MIKPIVALATVLVLICCLASPLEAKLLRRQRIYDDSFGGSPYGGYDGPQTGMATGERAIMTIRGARGPYGMPPSRIQIEDNLTEANIRAEATIDSSLVTVAAVAVCRTTHNRTTATQTMEGKWS